MLLSDAPTNCVNGELKGHQGGATRPGLLPWRRRRRRKKKSRRRRRKKKKKSRRRRRM